MKTDSIFYRLFQRFPGIFFELIGSSPVEASGYDFTSVEVKQLAFRLDGLLLPKTDSADKPFYVVEVQKGRGRGRGRGAKEDVIPFSQTMTCTTAYLQNFAST